MIQALPYVLRHCFACNGGEHIEPENTAQLEEYGRMASSLAGMAGQERSYMSPEYNSEWSKGVMLLSMTGWHRRWPGRPAKTLLHATVRRKGFRFAPALAGLKSPFSRPETPNRVRQDTRVRRRRKPPRREGTTLGANQGVYTVNSGFGQTPLCEGTTIFLKPA